MLFTVMWVGGEMVGCVRVYRPPPLLVIVNRALPESALKTVRIAFGLLLVASIYPMMKALIV